VYTKDLAGDDAGDGECVESVDKGLPDFDVAAAFAFVVKAIDAGDVGTFMVST
jgi:hypothetical protein